MNLRLITLSLFISFAFVSFGEKNKVCITFDDLPVAVLSDKSDAFQYSVTTKLLGALTRHRIPAIGFVNEDKLYKNNKQVDKHKVNMLRLWLKAHMDLGNHTFSHLDFNQTTCNKYFQDIIDGEKITRPLMQEYFKSLRYFRHPYLNVGETKSKADSLHNFLKSRKYIEAPITIENADWVFALAYDSAMVKKDSVLMKSIGETYVNYMADELKFMEGLSVNLFGRNIRQVVLLHTNALNADFLGKLAEVYERNNYKFIRMKDALKDKAYQTPVTVYGDWGSSWIYRWAYSSGKQGNFFAHAPVTPRFILKLAKMERE